MKAMFVAIYAQNVVPAAPRGRVRARFDLLVGDPGKGYIGVTGVCEPDSETRHLVAQLVSDEMGETLDSSLMAPHPPLSDSCL